jgi:hypothetical protein
MVVRELGNCKVDLVSVHKVRWEKSGTERAEYFTFFYVEGNGNQQLETGFLYIRESYQWLGEWSLLVIRCRISY